MVQYLCIMVELSIFGELNKLKRVQGGIPPWLLYSNINIINLYRKGVIYMGFPTAPDMKPASWQQIRENMNQINKIIKTLGDLNGLLGDEYPDFKSLMLDLINLLNDLNGRIGTITAIVENIANDLPPSDYKYDITYEFKYPGSIGLGDKRGFEDLTHCLMQTVIAQSIGEEETNFKPYQIAFGNDMKQYWRSAVTNPDGTIVWGEWTELRYGTRIEVYETMPEADQQAVGDIWLLPV